MVNKEGLYSQIVRNFHPETPVLDIDGRLTQSERDLHFAMRCNGYFMMEDSDWAFNSAAATPFNEQFKGTKVSFFGPNQSDEFFNSDKDIGYERFLSAFNQPSVTDVIRKYRQVDEDLAATIAYFLGGIIRHRISKTVAGVVNNEEIITNAVRFISRRTLLGEERSAEAIAAAMSVYLISGGLAEEDKTLTGGIYHMSEAIREDPVTPSDTVDLGLSQVARLHSFLEKTQGRERQDLGVIASHLEAFDGFPTVGAEFHFSPSSPKEDRYFWLRLALLNMSQYQRGSYVQLSRNDRGVVEVRMNPSIYPITIANWNHMRQLLPELNQTFFTITINRRGVTKDFHWTDSNDKILLNQLRALGLISYAGIFENIPHTEKPEEIGFGKVYLGQTVRLKDEGYRFSGGWYSGEGTEGQMGIYAGFGDNLPYLAYYLSMALAKPGILKSVYHQLSKVTTLEDALYLKAASRIYVSREIQNKVEADHQLNRAFEAGQEIVELLNP